MDVQTKFHLTQICFLMISGAGLWYSNFNGEYYQVWRIAHVKLFIRQQTYSTAVHEFCCTILILILLQVKTIWSMMGIIIALSIRIIFYSYWMILSRRSYGCNTKNSYDKILCSQVLWYNILILQHKWRALSGIEDCPCEAFRSGI